jgi:hypothetical protein
MVASSIKFFDGGRASLYYIDDANIIYPIFVNNSTLTPATPQALPISAKSFRFSTANSQSLNYLGASSDTSLMLVEEENPQHINYYTVSGLDYIYCMNLAPNSLYFYFLAFDHV